MADELPSSAQIATEFDTCAQQLVAATRRFSGSQWTRSTTGSPAEIVVAELITMAARLAHALEVGTSPAPASWRAPAPAPYPGALPDRLAVVAHDLVAALRSASAGDQVRFEDRLSSVNDVAAYALMAIEATARSLRISVS